MTISNKPLILVDGSSYLYRAFHALPALINSKGYPTGAVYGVIAMLKRLLSDYQPDYIAVIFDSKSKTFRDELYGDYKATRKAMPDDLVRQISPLHHIIKAMGIPLVTIEGVEADDIIGTLAKKASDCGMKTIISTGDKDFAQLVNDDVTLVNTMTNTVLNPTNVTHKFGVPPERIIDYLTLVGDSSDNIPGVAKVGPKTAVKWLQHYGSLTNLIAKASDIPGKIGDNLRAFIPQIPLTQTLVTIKVDVPLPFEIHDLKQQPCDHAALLQLFKEMEFKNWLAELLSITPPAAREQKKYTIITTEAALDNFLQQINHHTLIAFDTETTHLDYMQAKLVGISLSANAELTAYIPFGHDYANAPTQLPKTLALAKLQPLLNNPAISKVAQNIKYDLEVLANVGVSVRGKLFDTMLESYVLDSLSSHDMDSLALKHLGKRTISYEDIAGKGAKQILFNQVPIEQAGPYAAEDADITLQLHLHLWPRIQKQPGLQQVLSNIEMPLVSVLARMERTGILIDPDKLKHYGEVFTKRVQELMQEIYVLAGKEFNIGSPKQLQEVLFQALKLPILHKTPTGQPSTADNVLQELAMDFELPRLIIECRALNKLISTYTSRLVEQINPQSKRLHTSYNQAGTATGRLSSSDPNLQNIPIRSREGRLIRETFIAPGGYQLISADYSQIELRLMAHFSQDENLLRAFNQNLDIHQTTAAEVWGVALDQVTPEMRRNAKTINFGLIYGMSAFGLSKQLKISRQDAQAYIDRYFARYPKVKEYMQHSIATARQQGYVETLWGRRLYIPNINATPLSRQRAAERIAINAPLQGSSADIIKLAMINIDKWLIDSKLPIKMLLQVHDELVFEAKTDILDHVIAEIKTRMVSVVNLSVPLQVSVGVGDNWDIASQH